MVIDYTLILFDPKILNIVMKQGFFFPILAIY